MRNKTVFQQLTENPKLKAPYGVHTTQEGINIIVVGDVDNKDFYFNATISIKLDKRLFLGGKCELNISICNDNPATFDVETMTIQNLWSMSQDLYTVDNGIVFFYVDKFGRDMIKVGKHRRECSRKFSLMEMVTFTAQQFNEMLSDEEKEEISLQDQV